MKVRFGVPLVSAQYLFDDPTLFLSGEGGGGGGGGGGGSVGSGGGSWGSGNYRGGLRLTFNLNF